MKNNLYLIDANSEYMTEKEWYLFMHDKNIIQYKFDNIKIPLEKSKGIILSKRFSDFDSFLECLKNRFCKEYLEEINSFLLEFYNRNITKKLSKKFLYNDLYKLIIGKKFHKNITPQQRIGYIRKGYPLDKIDEIVREISIPLSLRRVEYWIKRGLSNEEAKLKISEYSKEANKGLYKKFIKQGFSEKEASDKVSEVRRLSSFLCIDKYIKQGKSKEEANVIVKLKAREITATSKEYWLKKGYPEEESIKRAKERCDKINIMYADNLKAKGLTDKEAKEKIHKHSLYMISKTHPLGGKYALMLFDYLDNSINKDFKNVSIFYGKKNKEYRINIPKDSDFRKFKSYIKLDFFIEFENNLKIDVEYDSMKLHDLDLDNQRDKFLKSKNIKVFRISENRLGRRTTDVIKTLKEIYDEIKSGVIYENNKIN